VFRIQIRINIDWLDPVADPGGQKRPTKIVKREEISSFEGLDALFQGLKASPVALTSFMEAYCSVNCKFL
jgi:hypothetical protein